MFGHDHVTVDAHGKASPHVFQALDKEIVDGGRAEVGLSVVATEGEKVGMFGVVKPSQAAGHEQNLHTSVLEYSDIRHFPKLASKDGREPGTPVLRHDPDLREIRDWWAMDVGEQHDQQIGAMDNLGILNGVVYDPDADGPLA